MLHNAGTSALALVGPVAVTGQVTVKWTSNVKLTSKTSSVNVTVVTRGASGSYASPAVTAGHAWVSGDFAGSGSGATSTLYSETTQAVTSLTTTASRAKGPKAITLGADGTHLLPHSLHLGKTRSDSGGPTVTARPVRTSSRQPRVAMASLKVVDGRMTASAREGTGW